MKLSGRRFPPAITLISALSLILLSAGCNTASSLQESSSRHGGKPRIFIAGESLDLGEVESGDVIRKSVIISNRGGAPLVIEKIESSCGCTVASLSSTELMPGVSAVLNLEVDTSGKIGGIVKKVSVYSTDPVEPLKLINIRFTVTVPGHGEMQISGRHIFKGKCRGCHVDRGAGLSGRALFEADCAMCHREKDAGYSPALPIEVLQTLSAEELREATANGVQGTSMPGYHSSAGGPLDSGQIESLINHLRSRE